MAGFISDIRYRKIFKKFREYTMVPEEIFIGNCKLIDEFKNIEGDYVECGVWKGGMSAAAATILGTRRKYLLFDSFQGLPEAAPIDGTAAIDWQRDEVVQASFKNCSAEKSFAVEAMKLAGKIDYELVEGWFEQTLPGYAFNNPVAVLRLDGDWYESTLTCLKYLFPQVAEGGLIILDDYYFWDGCSKAVHDYLSSIQSTCRMYQSARGISYIIKRSEIKEVGYRF